MASQEDILRVAKILARATSSEPNEASVALNSAYKRMRRDQVGIRQLLTLPLEELYQEALVKLVILILENQENLSPPERRKAFENFMSLITARFSGGSINDHENLKSSSQKEEDFRQEQQDNIRRQADKTRQEEAHQREEKERRTASAQTEAKQRKSEQDYGQEGRNSADLGARSPPPSKNPKESTSQFIGVASIVFVIISIILMVKNESPKAIQPSTKSIPIFPDPQVKIQNPIVFEPTHSVAALSANLRSKPTSRSIVKAVLKRGDTLKFISKLENFLEVQLPTGEVAFISKDLVIPIEDFSRLINITARDYINHRSSEHRIDLLIRQADDELQKNAFASVVYDLIIESNSIETSLEKLQAARKFDIEPDTSASTWFALSANAAMQSNDYESAFWEARAAIEGDPANPEHHVAFGLANYQLKNYETVKVVGYFLPKIAPTSTNAWMLFALANALTPESNDQLTKSAFVLAIKLSRNANNTRRYFREFAEKTSQLRIRELLNSALLQESQNPKLFTDVSRLLQVAQINQP